MSGVCLGLQKMRYSKCCLQLLLCMYISLSLMKQTLCWRAIQSYGPTICEVLCKREKYCSSAIFEGVQLKCQPVANTSMVKPSCYTTRKEPDSDVSTSQLLTSGKLTNNARQSGERSSLQTGSVCPPADVTRLHDACADENLTEVKRLVCQGVVDINCRGEEEVTAVMIAAEVNDEDIFDFLVEQDSDLSLLDQDAWSVLHFACEGGSTNIVKKLLDDFKLDIEQRNDRGLTALMHAVYMGHLPVVEMLKERGADLKSVDKNKKNILHYAGEGGDEEMVLYVLSLNIVDIDSRALNGQSPVMVAVRYCHMPVVELFIDRGADMRIEDETNSTVLHLACRCGNVEMVKKVLSLNIFDIECRDEKGQTPLAVAVSKGSLSVVKLLIDRVANLETEDHDKLNILHKACISGDVPKVKFVLSLKVFDIECKAQNGQTPLMLAARKGHIPIVKMLKNRGASVTVVDNDGRNVIHVACEEERSKMVRYLITLKELRGFVRRKDSHGYTPLDIAVNDDADTIVAILKSRD